MCPDSNITSANDVQNLIEYLADAFGTMAMVNYPYNTSFIRPLPGWPVNASCELGSHFLENNDPPSPGGDDELFKSKDI